MDGDLRILLVEDKDDAYVVSALLNAHNIPVNLKGRKSDRHVVLTLGTEAAVQVEVKIADGYDNLLERLPVECKGSGLARLAAIVDADLSLENTWAQLKPKLHSMSCEGVPDRPLPEGAILQIADGPRVGVWVMPDNTRPGMLEDFTLSLVPESDPILPLVRQFVDGIPTAIRPFKAVHLAKVLIHIWLAMREDPGRPLGIAIKANYLDANKPECQPFLRWLRGPL